MEESDEQRDNPNDLKVKVFYTFQGSNTVCLCSYRTVLSYSQKQRYVTIPLRPCLLKLCTSCPDMLLQPDSDCAVYSAYFQATSSNEKGNAAEFIWEGHGLLSWLLEEDDNHCINGRLYQRHIEVQLELHQTPRMSKAEYYHELTRTPSSLVRQTNLPFDNNTIPSSHTNDIRLPSLHSSPRKRERPSFDENTSLDQFSVVSEQVSTSAKHKPLSPLLHTQHSPKHQKLQQQEQRQYHHGSHHHEQQQQLHYALPSPIKLLDLRNSTKCVTVKTSSAPSTSSALVLPPNPQPAHLSSSSLSSACSSQSSSSQSSSSSSSSTRSSSSSSSTSSSPHRSVSSSALTFVSTTTALLSLSSSSSKSSPSPLSASTSLLSPYIMTPTFPSSITTGGRRKKRDTKPPNADDVRTYTRVEQDEHGNYRLPVEIDSWTVYSLGHVVYDRPAYHNQRYIYPLGYKVKKWYRSMIDPKSDTQYQCEIVDGGQVPMFRLQADDDPGRVYTGPTPTTVWTIVVRKAFAIRNMDYGHNPVGPDFFGLRKNAIAKMIQDLPNADKCSNYIWQKFMESNTNKSKTLVKRKFNSHPASDGGVKLWGAAS